MTKDIKLSKEEKMVFTLLDVVLHNEFKETCTPLFTEANDEEWKKSLRLAQEFGVLALVCHGITLLPEDLMPNRIIKMQCIKTLYKHENLHKNYCKTIVELEKLFNQHGIGMMVMKGVGISAYYPIPSLRRCGDIDIYTYSLDTARMSDEEANKKSDNIIRNLGIKVETHNYKHSCFTFNGIEIENHKCFLNIQVQKEAVELDQLLRRIKNPQRFTFHDEYDINIASPEFNSIFIAFHAMQHLGEVLSVYHIFDYACILKKYGMIVPKEVKAEGFLKFVNSITSLSNKLFGMNIPVEVNEELDKILLYDILRNPYHNKPIPQNTIKWLIYKTKANLYGLSVSKHFVDVSLWKATKNTIVLHWKKYFG